MSATATLLQPNSSAGLLSACYEELNRIADFAPDWDGYGAKALDSSIYRSVMRWMIEWSAELGGCHLVATSRGGIQLEWHEGGRILELEFVDADTIEYLKWWPAGSVESEGSIDPSDDGACGELLGWLHGESA